MLLDKRGPWIERGCISGGMTEWNGAADRKGVYTWWNDRMEWGCG